MSPKAIIQASKLRRDVICKSKDKGACRWARKEYRHWKNFHDAKKSLYANVVLDSIKKRVKDELNRSGKFNTASFESWAESFTKFYKEANQEVERCAGEKFAYRALGIRALSATLGWLL
jgi:hypothetical protein